MPADARLLDRLRAERPVYAVLVRFQHLPAGPFGHLRLTAGGRADALADLAAGPAFGSLAAAERAYAALATELRQVADGHPGLPDRAGYLKLDDFADRGLVAALARAGRADAAEFADALLAGTEPLAPPGGWDDDGALRLAPPAVVAEAAGVLRRVRPDDLGEYEELRHVYVSAAAHGEAVLIG